MSNLFWKLDLSGMVTQLTAKIVGLYHDPLHESIFRGLKMSNLCWKCDLSYDYTITGQYTVTVPNIKPILKCKIKH